MRSKVQDMNAVAFKKNICKLNVYSFEFPHCIYTEPLVPTEKHHNPQKIF